ncbi:cobalt-precorrin 5A hydrolase [Clostridium saccharobutylicum]|uniref:Cobalamin biosynthesis protein CbiG n=1 Tax=Clostridium saccharobutylicum TaxID=169679 RepID=A0A1S8MTE8_CLOSA|nr:cobalt-precorrin 5A hydrolase [Clostridium saccharobutylicum]OOM07445.1 cobalamin biosynthesis protein CbiG [Clostridium saccharobutylicum]
MNKDIHINVEEKNTVSIICPSPKGIDIALKLQKYFNGRLYIKQANKDSEIRNVTKLKNQKNEENGLNNQKFNNKKFHHEEVKYYEKFNLNDISKEAMQTSKGIVFISSTGIAVRAIAQFLEGKDKDPGVVVVDLCGKYAINILSGHLGGGNKLTIEVSKVINAKPIITTATDNLEIIAPDVIAKNNNLIIEDLKKAKYISSLLVDGKIVGIKDEYNIVKITNGYKKIEELKENSIWITNNLSFNNDKLNCNNINNVNYSKILRLIKRDIVLGIGCRRGTSYEKLKEFIDSSLIKYNFDIRSVKYIVSVDVKKDEEGIIKLAQNINCEFKTFERCEIKTVQDKYEKSDFVLKTLGITGVCEPCVDLMGAKVIISKVKHEGMTLAIGVLLNVD